MKYKVGNRVKVLSDYDDVEEGSKGIIVDFIKEENGSIMAGIEFDVNMGGHECDGKSKNYHGYYVPIEIIELEKTSGGLTEEELEISKSIVATWNGFVKLIPSHPNDLKEFHVAIHTLQKTLGMRVLRRDYPDYWIDKGDK